jgi:hypothetical protein
MANHMNVAHRWAQMNKNLNVSGYAMFADGYSIFSHGRHFEIARWVETTPQRADEAQAPTMAVLFTARDYSVSTSKHKSYTRRAIRSSATVYTIPPEFWPIHGNAANVTEKQKRDANASAAKGALAWYEAQALESYAKAARARSNGPWLIQQAERQLDEAADFARSFGVKFVRPDLDGLKARAEKRAAETAKATRKANKLRKEREAAALAEQRELQALWLAGDTSQRRLGYFTAPDGSAYVRRSPDGESLETSQGASVPWEHALKAFRFIKLCRERGEAFHTNGRTVRVGHYQVSEITARGDMVAGCHRFKWEVMEALAIKEGVAGFAASSEAVSVSQ